jgi:MFS family permease
MATALIAVSLAELLTRTSPTGAQESLEHVSRARTWVLALTSIASFMVAVDVLVVSTALSTIRVDFGTTIEALGWTINAYNLSFAVLLLTGAALGDRFGRRRIFSIGLALFTAASIACALAPNVSWLIAARAVQGAGGAMITPIAMALLSSAFPPAERARALGVFSGLTGLALLGGPVVGGASCRVSPGIGFSG